jgi:nitrogen fixation/metabolism regulation signal transduction histidine kinase
MIEAIRQGDYTMRGRRGQQHDTLGDLAREINLISATLEEERLASLAASALMQAVLEELDVAVFAFDEKLLLKFANRAAAELMGRATESLLGRSAGELGLSDLLARSGVISLSFPERTGRFEIRRRSFRDRGLPHTLIVASDLSRALREEERRAWQRLIRVIAHEINNSLTPIKSIATTLPTLLEDCLAGPVDADRDSVLEGLTLIKDRATSLSKFVASYSQLARLPPPSKESVSLNALLLRLLSLGNYSAATLAAAFEVRIEADAGQLEQALLNLLKNAVEAAGDATGLEISLTRTRETATIEMRDCGEGIANPDNLFVPFFTTKPGGSGIGLALSRQIIEAHGGTLTLENRTDRPGCIAKIALPVE